MKKHFVTAVAIILLLSLAGAAFYSFSGMSLTSETKTEEQNKIQLIASGLNYNTTDAALQANTGSYPVTVPALSQQETSHRLIVLSEESMAEPNEYDGGIWQYRHDYLLDKFWLRYRVSIITITFVILLLSIHAVLNYKARKRHYGQLKASEERLRNVTNKINGGVLVLDPERKFQISYVNDGFIKLTGYTSEEISKIHEEDYASYIHPDDWEKLNRVILPEKPDEEGDFSIQLRVMSRSGKYIPVLVKASLVKNEHGENEMFCVVMDISREQSVIEELRLEQERHRILIEKSDEILFEINYEENSVKASPKFKEKFGWSLPKTYWGDKEPDLTSVYKEDRPSFTIALEEIECGKVDGEFVARIIKKDGTPIWCKILYHVMKTDGRRMQLIGKLTDIDSEMKEKQTLIIKAQLDSLTGLYNKETFRTRCIDYLTRHPDRNCAVVFFDVDNFKEINDRLGHAVGDRALCDISIKMQSVFSKRDILGRFGGDEFCVFVKDTQKTELDKRLNRLLDELRLEYSEGGRTVSVSVSIGAVCSGEYGSDFNKLLEYADKAQYFAKGGGKDRYTLYCDSIRVKEYDGNRARDILS